MAVLKRGGCCWVLLLLVASCSDRSTLGNEATATLCVDSQDNDGDGLVDCADPDCSAFCGVKSDGGTDLPLVTEQGPGCGCDDQLDCTDDSCPEGGSCQHTIKSGWCLIEGTCYADQATSGCQRCEASQSQTQWSPLKEGDACDDNDPCTKDDKCQSDSCQGTAYSCASDWLDCTEDRCDGKGGCSYVVKPHWCLLDGYCVEEGDKWGKTSGPLPPPPPDTLCVECKPSVSQTSWTPISDGCEIYGLCYKAGETDQTGCQVCDPTKSAKSWSPGPGTGCQIGGSCYGSGAKDTTGCKVCDPAQSTTSWSAGTFDCHIGVLCYQAGDLDTSGCSVCDPSKSTTSWTASDSGCKVFGKCFKPGEKDPTGCGICDPSKSTTAFSPLPDTCSIEGYCYPNGAIHPGGCAVCDTSKATSAWTPLGNGCLISDYYPPVPGPVPGSTLASCFKPGEKPMPGACEVCDPSQSTTSWSKGGYDCMIEGFCLNDGDPPPQNYFPTASTCALCDSTQSKTSLTVLPGYCLVDMQCFGAGTPDKSGCGICDPSQSTTSWTPVQGKCAIPLYPGGPPQCFSNGANHPGGSCAKCDTSVSSTSWTVQSSYDGCLLFDITQKMETCLPADTKDFSGCQVCDPSKSKTSWTPLSGKCFIGPPDAPPDFGQCYDDGASHPAGSCAKCDVATSAKSWTVLSGCLLMDPYSGAEKCYADGAADSSGCLVCDPDQSATQWTPAPNKCVIEPDPYGPPSPKLCQEAGDVNPSASCAVCDPAQSSTSWSAVAGKCYLEGVCYDDGAKDQTGCLQCSAAEGDWAVVSGASQKVIDFDDGTLQGVTVTAAVDGVGWQLSQERVAGGTHSLYYGNPAKKNFDTPGKSNEGTVTLPSLTLPAGKKAALLFALWADIERIPGYDDIEIKASSSAGQTTLWKKPAGFPMKSWQTIRADLSAHAGASITVTLRFSTNDDMNNEGEGIYLDSIRLAADCP